MGERNPEDVVQVQLLRQQLGEMKRLLDDEMLKKVIGWKLGRRRKSRSRVVCVCVQADTEDQCRRLEEEMRFKVQLCEQQLEEVRTRREVEITQLDGKLQVISFYI